MDNNSKMQKMICFIINYEEWDDIIHEHSCKFFENYSIHPNLLLASKITWKKIDKYANLYNPENIKAPDDSIVDDNQDEELKSLSCFVTSEYSLEFCLDEKINENYFILVFDEDPIFDGEPYSNVENEDVIIYKRIA